MRLTRADTLVTVGLVGFVLATASLSVSRDVGGPQPYASVLVILVTLVLAVIVAGAAWPIRQWTAGRRQRRVDPLRAVRVLALAKATALTGSLLAGAWAGSAVPYLSLLDVEAQRERAVLAGVAALASVVMLVAGVLAERWCRVPPEDDDPGTADAAT